MNSTPRNRNIEQNIQESNKLFVEQQNKESSDQNRPKDFQNLNNIIPTQYDQIKVESDVLEQQPPPHQRRRHRKKKDSENPGYSTPSYSGESSPITKSGIISCYVI